MQDNANYSYISTIIDNEENTHYIKDAEAREAISALETGKQDKIDSTHKIPAENISGLAEVALSGDYDDLVNKLVADTAMSDSSTNPVQNRVVKAYIDDTISDLGSVLDLKGSKTSEAAIKAITSAKKGDVWINTEDNSEWVCMQTITVATPNAWEKLGATIDLSGYALTADLGTLAYKSSANGTYTPSGTISINSYTPRGSIELAEYTPTGSISMNAYTPAGTIGVGSGNANYTPSGSISINSFTPSGSISVGDGTPNYTPSGNVTMDSYTPEGSVAAPTVTVTPATATVNSITNVGTLPTFSMNVTNETLSFNFNQGTLPSKGTNQTVVTGILSATATAPAFTGTAKAPTGSFSGNGVELEFSGSSVTPSGSFTGNGVKLDFTGTAVAPKGSFSGTPSAPTGTFTGTAAVLTGSFTGSAASIAVS